MRQTAVNQKFDEVLEPLGAKAADFFLAASLYHARKVSFEAAAHLADLSFDAFHQRLQEHFGKGFIIEDEVAFEDIDTVKTL